jgi:hypothetical protein
MSETVNVRVGTASSGRPVFEELLVQRIATSRYRLLASPGLALGLAAGDVFEVGASDAKYTVVERGGNVCVQVYIVSENGDRLETALSRSFMSLGGRRDGKTSKQLVYTLPVTAGFERIEKALREVLSDFPKAEWFYGNIYDPDDGVTPLNWWLH